MGTGLKEKDIKIKKSISLYSLLIVPVILVGLGLLGYQTYSLFTGKSFKEINFEIGSLWNSEQSQVNAPIQKDDIILEVVAENRIRNRIKPVPKPIYNYHPKHITAKQTSIVKPGLVKNNIKALEISTTSIDKIDFGAFSLVGTNPLVRSYIKRIESDYLFDPNVHGKKGKWYIGLSFAPSFNYRHFSYKNTEISGVKVADNTRYTFGMTETYRNESDKAISSYYAGVDVGLNIGKKLSISSGLYYAVYGENISVSRMPTNDINSADAEFYDQTPLYASPENTEQPKSLNYDNRYSYVEIPLMLTYDVVERENITLSVQIGVNGQMLDHTNALVYDFDTDYYYWLNRTDFEIYKKYGLGTSTGFVISQFIGDNVEVFANPQFKYNITSTFKDPYPVDQHQYSTGLRLGIKHHLN